MTSKGNSIKGWLPPQILPLWTRLETYITFHHQRAYRDAQSVVTRSRENDHTLALELVQDVGQVAVLVLRGNEQVLLHQRLFTTKG